MWLFSEPGHMEEYNKGGGAPWGAGMNPPVGGWQLFKLIAQKILFIDWFIGTELFWGTYLLVSKFLGN